MRVSKLVSQGSIQHPQPKLNLPRRVGRSRDRAEGHTAQAGIRPRELWCVERIERFRPELQRQLLPQLEVLEQRQVRALDAGRSHVRQRSRDIAELKRRGLAEYGRLEVLVQAVLHRAFQLRARSIIVR